MKSKKNAEISNPLILHKSYFINHPSLLVVNIIAPATRLFFIRYFW